jgi:2-haloacid dehalogenase
VSGSRDRWASFDCYGTLIDWDGGVASAMRRLWPDAERDRLIRTYHGVEPLIQEGEGASLPYREVLTRALRAVAAIEARPLAEPEAGTLADSLPSWEPFEEVAPALAELRERGWRLAILSNTDPDLLAASLARIGVPVELAITATDAGSYKPAPGHWDRFFADSGADPDRHVHVAASLFHDIAPAAERGMRSVWINRLGERSELTRDAELPDLADLPAALERIVPA